MSAPVGTGRGRGPARGTRARPLARPLARPSTRTRLTVVPARAVLPGRSGAFVALLVAVLAGGLVGLLVLNTAMQRSAFQLDRLRDEQAALGVRRQVLDLRVERLRSPDRLARAATELGMVQLAGPVFLRLDDGTVLGDPVPAAAGTGPQLVPVDEPHAGPGRPERAQPERTRQPEGREQRRSGSDTR